MRYYRKIVLSIIAAFAAGGCVEPYDPDITRYEDVLVIDGTFTNASEDHVLRLARSYGYYDFDTRMETGAVVGVTDDQGNAAFYTETDEGIYTLDHEAFSGVPGRSYKIVIETESGNRYESDYQLLKQPVEIDSLYYEIKEDDPLNSGYAREGLQIYVDARDETESTHYYRWDWTETWEFTVPHKKPGFFNKTKCWDSRDSRSINIFSTTELEEDAISRRKLNFVASSSYVLSRMYTVKVRQYALTLEAYDFWRKLELANEHTGSLFDPPPTPVNGNLQNVDDPYEPVLGFFQVSGVSEKRIFIDRANLPKSLDLTTGNEHCEGLVVMGEGLNELQSGWYLLERYWLFDTLWTSMSSNVDCYDCTMKGTNIRPEFWPDEE